MAGVTKKAMLCARTAQAEKHMAWAHAATAQGERKCFHAVA